MHKLTVLTIPAILLASVLCTLGSVLPSLAYDNAYCSIQQSNGPLHTARAENLSTKIIIYCEDKNTAGAITQTATRTCMYNTIGKNNVAITPNYSCSNIGGRSLTVSEWNNLHSRYSIICSECPSPGKWTPGYPVGQ